MTKQEQQFFDAMKESLETVIAHTEKVRYNNSRVGYLPKRQEYQIYCLLKMIKEAGL